LPQAMTSAPALADDFNRLKLTLETRNSEIRTQLEICE
jgi:hypothetical protein